MYVHTSLPSVTVLLQVVWNVCTIYNKVSVQIRTYCSKKNVNTSAVKTTHYLIYSARYVNVPVAIEIIQGIACSVSICVSPSLLLQSKFASLGSGWSPRLPFIHILPSRCCNHWPATRCEGPLPSHYLWSALFRHYWPCRILSHMLHIYPLCGIFYFPWHRHQIEGTNGF